MKQLLESQNLLRKSGDVVVTSSMVKTDNIYITITTMGVLLFSSSSSCIKCILNLTLTLLQELSTNWNNTHDYVYFYSLFPVLKHSPET